MRAVSLLIFLLAAIAIVVSGSNESRLTVVSPPGLTAQLETLNKQLRGQYYKDEDSNTIETELSNFGSVQYGSMTIGDLHISNPFNACNKTEVKRNQTEDFNTRIPFLLVGRGDCAFADKVYNAQEIGAQIVIIADNSNSGQKVIMVDNGHGKNVHITSIFISKRYGDLISSYSNEHPDEIIKLSLHLIQKQSSFSKVLFWIDLANPLSMTMIRNFSKVRKSISGNSFSTSPMFSITKVPLTTKSTDCKKLNNEQFCAPDPDLPQREGENTNQKNVATGQDVINEVIRQSCIHEQSEDNWFTYFEAFSLDCYLEPQYYSTCGKEILKSLSTINTDKLKECVEDDKKSSRTLSIMASENTQFKIYEWPTVSVNDLVYRGNLNTHGIAEVICSSLKDIDSGCTKIISPLDSDINHENSGSSSIWLTLCIVFLGLIALFFVLTYAYKRIIRKEISQDMNQQVNQMVSQYIAFYESRGKTQDQSDI